VQPIPINDIPDYAAVCQLAKIYAIGIDLKDRELCSSAFSADAKGEVQGELVPLNDYLNATYGIGSTFHSTQHIIANQYVKLNGDEAVVWSYGIAIHKPEPGSEGTEIIAGVQYRDKCRRTEDGWVIIERFAPTGWLDIGPARASQIPAL
jgi:hypothetical protein